MIKKLRIKPILVSMLSLLVVLLAIVGSINLLNVHRMTGEADGVLDILAENDGRLPMQEEFTDLEDSPEYASPEVPYESRYFFVLLDEDEGVIATNIERIAAVDQETAVEYAQAALDSLWISLLGMLAVFLLMMLASGRIIKPVSDSYEKQKQFITDAGHEIKTPLAIIDADAGLIEMENGSSEWLQDIQTQVRRLTGLTNDLIYLARTEEAQGRQEMLDFPLSDMVEEQVRSFQALAIQNNRQFISHIQPMLTLHGDEKMIGQLVSILLDNAIKYSDAGGEIRVMLEKQGRAVHLSVFNTVESINQQELGHLFDRFYRTDRSRNSKTGGYGIGLSIASAVTAAHKGKILAASRDGHSLLITVILPA